MQKTKTSSYKRNNYRIYSRINQKKVITKITRNCFFYAGYLFATTLLLLPKLVTATEFHGLIVAERDITQPVVAKPVVTVHSDPCPSRSGDDQTVKPAEVPDLPNAMAVKTYRQQLKAMGVVVTTPSLSGLDAAFINQRLAALIGQPIDSDLIKEISAVLVEAIDRNASLLADVYLPQQQSNDGYLVAVVKPATAGTIVAEGQEHYEMEQILCEINTRPGDRIDLRQLAEDLQWLNRTPWRITNVSYAAGKNMGEADIVLTTQDRNLFRPYASVDNSGTRSSGRNRFKIGVSVGDPFGLFDHRIDYALARSNVSGALEGHSFSYNFPTDDRWNITVNLAYSLNDVLLENGNFRSKGENITAGISANRVLPGFTKHPQWLHEITLGSEWKKVGSSLEFGQSLVQGAAPELLHLFVDYSFGASDHYGKFNSYSHLVLSPGFSFRRHTNEEFRRQRPQSDIDYWYLKQTFDRTFRLPKSWSARALMNLQYSNEPLPYSERAGITGVNAVRGYYEDTLFSDRGVVINLEIATPNIDVELGGHPGKLQFFAFRDWGHSNNLTSEINNDLGSSGRKNTVSSHGLGLRFTLTPHIQLLAIAGRAERGLQQRDRDWLGHFSLVIGM